MNVWSLTDRGKVRQQNQDACFAVCDQEGRSALMIVCDGMGGALAGNVASAMAIEEFVKTLSGSCDENIARRIQDAVTAANTAVYTRSMEDPECSGMGTTMVGAVVLDDNVTVFNVGDSRAYLIRQRSIKKITVDHSVVEELVLRGDITREQSLTHPNRNLITRAIGTEEDTQCDLFFPRMKQGDYLLLCSDGLTNVLSDQEIMDEVIKGGAPDDCCQRLVDEVLRRGAPDNVTVVLLRK